MKAGHDARKHRPSKNMSEASASRLILASASPRRAQLLRARGYRVEVMPSSVDEDAVSVDGLTPAQIAERLSVCKARDVAARVSEGIVLAGDTIVALGARVIGKPRDRDEAREILRALGGTRQEVITGVALVNAATGEMRVGHDCTVVRMRAMSEEELETYLNGGAWEGKAGAYGIQDEGDRFVTRIEGSFTNVVGLPMEIVQQMLEDWGIEATDARAHENK